MGILQSYREKIKEAENMKIMLASTSIDFEDKHYMTLMIDSQIKEYERRLEKLTLVGASFQCAECGHWISDESSEGMKEFNGYKFCNKCLTMTYSVMLTKEAEEKWGLPVGTIKQDCRRGVMDKYIECGLIRKSGKYWIIHDVLWKLHYQKQYKEKNPQS